MSLAAVPVYLLVRRLGLGAGWALAGAALTVASPDLFFSSFLLADPIAYTLALSAVYAGVRALSAPTRRAQLAFLAFAGLATFARVQYVVLPVAFLLAALVVERGVRPVISRFRFTVALLALPLVGSLAFGPSRLLGYYSGVADLGIPPAAIAHWVATDSMLLAYSAGWVIVPGALIGLWLALARPRAAVERAFGALTLTYAGALFAEAALYASNGSSRFQERYLMTLLPLAFPAFCLYIRRGAPGRRLVAVIALALIGLSARVPLSGYTIGDGKQDSPFLLAVFRLEKAVGIDTGSLAVAVAVAGLSLLAIAIAYRVRLAPTAVAAALLFVGASSARAVAFDHHVAASVRRDYLPADARWIDHARLGSTLLIQTPTTPHARAHEELFWNTSLADVLFLDGATGIDAFGSKVVRLRGDGAMTAGGTPIHKPFAISNHGVRARFRGAVRVARGNDYELWRPASTPRMTLFVGGLYHDSWLAQSGNVKVFPGPSGRVDGRLRIVSRLAAEGHRADAGRVPCAGGSARGRHPAAGAADADLPRRFARPVEAPLADEAARLPGRRPRDQRDGRGTIISTDAPLNERAAETRRHPSFGRSVRAEGFAAEPGFARSEGHCGRKRPEHGESCRLPKTLGQSRRREGGVS